MHRPSTAAGMSGLAALCLVAVAACTTSPDPRPSESADGPPSAPADRPGAGTDRPTRDHRRSRQDPSPRGRDAAAVVEAMSRKQLVGQLIMIGADPTGVDAATFRAITRYHVGNVILSGRSEAGVRTTAARVQALQDKVSRSSTGGVRLYVATDQEGGLVQVLRGTGFSTIPSGLEQGRLSPEDLRADARRWGRQLSAAGVDIDLAPVLDTVPSASFASQNAPIGAFHRQYGYTVKRVTSHGLAFLRGMRDAGVAPVVKHFPGLGRVTGNTDVNAGVTDRTTTARDAYLRPFAAAVDAQTPFVMMSTAYYARIDPSRLAAFSPEIIKAILRDRLGFDGIVISDDLSNAKQVARWSPGRRALKFVAAGGDMVLGVDPAQAPAMTGALVHRARTHPAFARRVDDAALRIVTAKHVHTPTKETRP